MAICIAVFNPAQTKRILMNYHYVVNEFKLQKLPVFTIELVFDGCLPEIADAIHVNGNSFMFHKERLYRLLEKKIPKEFTKLAFLDADILFNDPSWYYNTSNLLDKCDVVQPFERCHWLDLTYTRKTLTRETVLKMKGDDYNCNYHPGFAWCMRRDWYNKVGFFDWALTGSGDALSVIAWLRKRIPSNFNSCPQSIACEFNNFKRLEAPRITYLHNVEVSHLYHGTRVNRQYTQRHELINVSRDVKGLVVINKEGVYEWADLKFWNPIFLKYFKNRNDDNLSEELKLDSNAILTS